MSRTFHAHAAHACCASLHPARGGVGPAASASPAQTRFLVATPWPGHTQSVSHSFPEAALNPPELERHLLGRQCVHCRGSARKSPAPPASHSSSNCPQARTLPPPLLLLWHPRLSNPPAVILKSPALILKSPAAIILQPPAVILQSLLPSSNLLPLFYNPLPSSTCNPCRHHPAIPCPI